MGDTHVIPVDDLMPHREHRNCWCCPTMEAIDTPQDAADGNLLVTHNALDMRELREKA